VEGFRGGAEDYAGRSAFGGFGRTVVVEAIFEGLLFGVEVESESGEGFFQPRGGGG